MYLHAWLAKNTSHEARILDAQAEGLDAAGVVREVQAFAPALVGLSAFTHSLVDVHMVVGALRAALPDLFIVLGGPHVGRFPDESINIDGVDAAVPGEGEMTLARLADALDAGGDLTEVRGLLLSREGETVRTAPAEVITELDGLPHPDRAHLDFRRYFNLVGSRAECATLVTSRGCPFRCAFCDRPREPYRARSPRDVVDEIEEIAALGIREIYFVDDTFTVDKARARAICEEIVTRGLRISWAQRARVDILDGEMLRLFRRAGCERIQFGVETGTDEGLAALSKGTTIAQVREAFRLTRRAGITSMAYFLIGCPFEKSRDDILKTIDFAIELDPDMALFNVLTPFPGSPIYCRGVEEGVIDGGAWPAYLASPSQQFRPPVWDRHLGRDELFELSALAYRRFYLRPRVVLRNLLQIRDVPGALRKVRAGLGILGMKKKAPPGPPTAAARAPDSRQA